MLKKELENYTHGSTYCLVYSLNSESWIVKNGLKSDEYFSGHIIETSDWTISQQISGVGPITIIGSQVRTNSQSIWMCDKTGRKQRKILKSYMDGTIIDGWIPFVMVRSVGDGKNLNDSLVGELLKSSLRWGIWIGK